ncbi:MAG TPA: helix-turn-helix domain-containing protein [Steroidobacteraceae bacterium]
MTPPEADITELPSSPGARLRREREARAMSEQQAAEALNLDPVVVTQLETNDFAALGAPVFVKGHLRRYAALLGLAEDEIVGAYERSKLQIGEPTLVPKSRIEMAPVRGRPRWPWVVGGIVTFLVAAILVAYLSKHGLPGMERAGDGDAAQAIAPATPGRRTADTAAQPPAFSSGTAAPGTATAPAGTAAATPTGPAPAPGPGQVSLQLKFTADSWVEIFDGSGKAVLYDLGKAGSERTVTATAPLSVTLGNGPGVGIAVNGRALPPPPRTQGVISRFSISADGTLH